jgi:hypothetical protein
MAMRYIKRGNTSDDIIFDTFLSLFITKSCTTIHNYLTLKEIELKKAKKTVKKSNPFLHK